MINEELRQQLESELQIWWNKKMSKIVSLFDEDVRLIAKANLNEISLTINKKNNRYRGAGFELVDRDSDVRLPLPEDCRSDQDILLYVIQKYGVETVYNIHIKAKKNGELIEKGDNVSYPEDRKCIYQDYCVLVKSGIAEKIEAINSIFNALNVNAEARKISNK